jgi:hypothetical protein
MTRGAQEREQIEKEHIVTLGGSFRYIVETRKILQGSECKETLGKQAGLIFETIVTSELPVDKITLAGLGGVVQFDEFSRKPGQLSHYDDQRIISLVRTIRKKLKLVSPDLYARLHFEEGKFFWDASDKPQK